MMEITCEHCTKKYRIDETKMKGDHARLKCANCDSIIVVENPHFQQPAQGGSEVSGGNGSAGFGGSFSVDQGVTPDTHGGRNPYADTQESASPSAQKPLPDRKTKPAARKKEKGLGLKGQLFLYLFVPFLVIFIAAILASGWQLNTFINSIGNESSVMVTKLAESIITANARGVAKQVRLFLDSHPTLAKENFQSNEELRKIATQKVGQTGYACIYAIDDDKRASLWAHPNDKLIGKDLLGVTRKPLGKDYPRFKRIITATMNGGEGQGYYLWQDASGQLREKFMVCTPVPRSNLFVASTTYIDEFTLPARQLLNRIDKQKDKALLVNTGMMVLLLALVAILVFFYGRNLTRRITDLSEIVDRISLGELEIEIKTKVKDEIGHLAEAISRMQDSLRISIERLRKRRKK
jgi:predicted Zn finger-like uncharacterized protein